ncbi:hypothetical protein D3C87_1595670 [compost metagenome]
MQGSTSHLQGRLGTCGKRNAHTQDLRPYAIRIVPQSIVDALRSQIVMPPEPVMPGMKVMNVSLIGSQQTASEKHLGGLFAAAQTGEQSQAGQCRDVARVQCQGIGNRRLCLIDCPALITGSDHCLPQPRIRQTIPGQCVPGIELQALAKQYQGIAQALRRVLLHATQTTQVRHRCRV